MTDLSCDETSRELTRLSNLMDSVHLIWKGKEFRDRRDVLLKSIQFECRKVGEKRQNIFLAEQKLKWATERALNPLWPNHAA